MEEIWQKLSQEQKILALTPHSDEKGRTPLILAVRSGQTDLVTILLTKSDIDPNHRDSYGNTALHYTVLSQQNTLLELLLANTRVNTALLNHSKYTVYDLLKEYCYEVFPFYVREFCFARLCLDQTLESYFAEGVYGEKSKETPEDGQLERIVTKIRALTEIRWMAGEHYSVPFPLHLFSLEMQREIILRHCLLLQQEAYRDKPPLSLDDNLLLPI